MNRPTTILCGLYSSHAVLLGHYATNSARNDAPWHTVGLVTVSALLVVAAVREYVAADERRAAAARAERAARPPDAIPRALRDDIALGWNDLTSACCLTAWASHGTDHDPDTCTRKDQTT